MEHLHLAEEILVYLSEVGGYSGELLYEAYHPSLVVEFRFPLFRDEDADCAAEAILGSVRTGTVEVAGLLTLCSHVLDH